MKCHPDERQPWWETTLIKYHPHERRPWSNTILMRDNPHQRLPRRMTIWRESIILKAILMRDHPSFVATFVKPFASYIHAKDSWPRTSLLPFQYTLWVWFMFLIWSLFRIWPWDETQIYRCAQWHAWEIPLFTDLSNRVSVFRANISLDHILVTEHSEHTTTKTAYVHCHFALYNCCFTFVFVTWISSDIILRSCLGSKHQLAN